MQKISRGNASQFYVAAELCRRGYSAVVTLGNTPNTDIFCSNVEGTKFAHIQVKTFVPDKTDCSVGVKAENYYSDNFFWVLSGIPHVDQADKFVYYIIPAKIMAKNVAESHQLWLESPSKNGLKHKDSNLRIVKIPPKRSFNGWDISKFRNNWELISEVLK